MPAHISLGHFRHKRTKTVTKLAHHAHRKRPCAHCRVAHSKSQQTFPDNRGQIQLVKTRSVGRCHIGAHCFCLHSRKPCDEIRQKALATHELHDWFWRVIGPEGILRTERQLVQHAEACRTDSPIQTFRLIHYIIIGVKELGKGTKNMRRKDSLRIERKRCLRVLFTMSGFQDATIYEMDKQTPGALTRIKRSHT